MSTIRTTRACQICGKPFIGNQDCYYCPDCAKQKKLDTVVKMRKCIDCGIDFLGGPRAKRCPSCSAKERNEISKKYRKNGAARPLGSTDICKICGKEYIVKSGRQKCCSPECQRVSVLAWQREHKKGYSKASGQDIKKSNKRSNQEKICTYCLRSFKSKTSTNLCSDYCRNEQRKYLQCIYDIDRGQNRDIQKYIDKRKNYREEVKNHDR